MRQPLFSLKNGAAAIGSGPLCLSSVVTLRALRDGTQLTAAQKTPLACGQTAFLSPRLAVRLLPGAQRFSLLQVEESVLAQVLSHIAQQSHRKL